jgi:hypothetical protein
MPGNYLQRLGYESKVLDDIQSDVGGIPSGIWRRALGNMSLTRHQLPYIAYNTVPAANVAALHINLLALLWNVPNFGVAAAAAA